MVTLLTINSPPLKYGVHTFNKLMCENSALLCSRFLITSTGLGCILIPDGNSSFCSLFRPFKVDGR